MTMVKTFNSKTPLTKISGIALKGQCDLVSKMVPLKVSKKKSFHRRNKNFEDTKILLIGTFEDLQIPNRVFKEGVW